MSAKRRRDGSLYDHQPRSPTTSSSSAMPASNEQVPRQDQGVKVLVLPGFPGGHGIPVSPLFRIGHLSAPSGQTQCVWLRVATERAQIEDDPALLNHVIPLLPGCLMTATVKEEDTDGTALFGIVCHYDAATELYIASFETARQCKAYRLYSEEEVIKAMWRRPGTHMASIEHCVTFAQHGVDAVCSLWPELDTQRQALQHETGQQEALAAGQPGSSHAATSNAAGSHAPPYPGVPPQPVLAMGLPVDPSHLEPLHTPGASQHQQNSHHLHGGIGAQLPPSTWQDVGKAAMMQRDQIKADFERRLPEAPFDGKLVAGPPNGASCQLLRAHHNERQQDQQGRQE